MFSRRRKHEPPTIRVVAAVVQRGGEYLICRRPEHKRHAGLWEFPGGKCEPGESDLAATRRELLEELGLEVASVGVPILEIRDGDAPFLIAFVPTTILNDPAARDDEDALQWTSLDRLLELPLAPCDRRLAEQLRANVARSK